MFANNPNHSEKTDIAAGFEIGIISAVDFASARAIVDFGEFQTPPLPWNEKCGHVQTWMPPKIGDQVLVLAPNNDFANAVIIGAINFDNAPAIGNDENPKIKVGETIISINYNSGEVTITAPKLILNGDLVINGEIDATGNIHSDSDVLAQAISLRNHKHTLVKAGTDKSGAPE